MRGVWLRVRDPVLVLHVVAEICYFDQLSRKEDLELVDL